MSEFKSIPTLEKLAERVALLHKAQVDLAQAMGNEIAELTAMIKQNTEITDEVLREMGLQITFLMQTIRVTRPLHGGIAGADGKVPVEVKTASQLYQESGRQKLIDQIEAVKRAQGLQTAEKPAAASGEQTGDTPFEDANGSTTDLPTPAAVGSKLITH